MMILFIEKQKKNLNIAKITHLHIIQIFCGVCVCVLDWWPDRSHQIAVLMVDVIHIECVWPIDIYLIENTSNAWLSLVCVFNEFA